METKKTCICLKIDLHAHNLLTFLHKFLHSWLWVQACNLPFAKKVCSCHNIFQSIWTKCWSSQSLWELIVIEEPRFYIELQWLMNLWNVCFPEFITSSSIGIGGTANNLHAQIPKRFRRVHRYWRHCQYIWTRFILKC